VQGENKILLRRNFLPRSVRNDRRKKANSKEARWLKYGVEFESIYIVGDFGVKCESKMTTAPRRSDQAQGPFTLVDDIRETRTGDLTRQNLPFFAGTIGLSQTFRVPKGFRSRGRRIFVEMAPPDAIVTAVIVNGKRAGKCAWQPFSLDITSLLKTGENEIEIELTGSCRNLLGPHHHHACELYGVSPGSFRYTGQHAMEPTGGGQWRDAYNLVRFGLTRTPRIVAYK
jgi:hypothetical protein